MYWKTGKSLHVPTPSLSLTKTLSFPCVPSIICIAPAVVELISNLAEGDIVPIPTLPTELIYTSSV
ncbi:MAG TPA: hypothetical protein DCF99_13760 [Flavobacteriaceae bacterium]|nr:hypothetical protein [Flavobacteriaceae bacterium]